MPVVTEETAGAGARSGGRTEDTPPEPDSEPGEKEPGGKEGDWTLEEAGYGYGV